MIIGVTGASGWIGTSVCVALRSHGIDVRRLVRVPRVQEDVLFDLLNPNYRSAWMKALEGCEAVVHCAAAVHRPVDNLQTRTDMFSLNDQGTKHLVETCSAAAVRTLVFVSSSSVYDWSLSDTVPKKEDQALGAQSSYARSKLAAEDHVRRFRGDWRIARLATVYGTGDRANFSRLAVALKQRRFVVPGNGSAKKTVIDVLEAGNLLGQLAMKTGLGSIIVNIGNPRAPSLTEICGAFSKACGFPPPLRAPLLLLRFGALAGDGLERYLGKTLLTSSILEKLTRSTVLDVSKLCALFPAFEWSDFQHSLEHSASYYAAQ